MNNIKLPIVPLRSISWQKVADKVFVIDELNQTIMKLEDVAAMLWCELMQNDKLEVIISRVQEVYDVEEKIIRKDVENFLIELKRNNIIEVMI